MGRQHQSNLAWNQKSKTKHWVTDARHISVCVTRIKRSSDLGQCSHSSSEHRKDTTWRSPPARDQVSIFPVWYHRIRRAAASYWWPVRFSRKNKVLLVRHGGCLALALLWYEQCHRIAFCHKIKTLLTVWNFKYMIYLSKLQSPWHTFHLTDQSNKITQELIVYIIVVLRYIIVQTDMIVVCAQTYTAMW